MKKFILLVLVAASLLASAQMDDQKLFSLKKSEKYRKMKSTGIGLTVVGGVLAIVGIAKMSNATYATNPNTGQQTTNDPNANQGALFFLAGAASLGVGIPFTIIGSINHKRYSKRLENMTLNLNLSPLNQGIGLTYKF